MKILQLTSDWKWTGPAAPMLELLLAQRDLGCEVSLACPEPPGGAASSLAQRAHGAGVEPTLLLERARGVSWWRDRADVGRLQALLRGSGFDVVHCWHTRDHVLALRATATLRGGGVRLPRVVRSHSSATPIAGWPWNRWLFGPRTAALVCVSPATAERNRWLRRGAPVVGVFGAVDLARFSPDPDPATRVRTRAQLGLEAEDRVVGIVARVQPHRRFDLLLEAMRRLARRDPGARLLVIGRGSQLDSEARRPAAQLGIGDRVVFAGYREGDFVDVLRTVDVFTYLVPGSDGTCRAVLEAAACGLPAVTTDRGALPDIVVHSETGLVVGEDPEALAAAWLALLDAPERRRAMGKAARARAESHFGATRLAGELVALYHDVL